MSADFDTLGGAADWFAGWLEQALPLWSTSGFDVSQATFHEALTQDLAPVPGERRSRAQTRQCWVYAEAGRLGGPAAYTELACTAEAAHEARYRRGDGLFAYAADPADGRQSEKALVYDQAFALLAWATLERATGRSYRSKAHALRGALAAQAHPAGGFRELGQHPFQANAHMHLLEASLAWEEGGDASWRQLSDSIVELALTRFIDRGAGVVHEFFDADWLRLPDQAGGLVEPGHLFEWAWLLDRWSRARGTSDLRSIGEALYASGLSGVDRARNAAVGSLWSDLAVREPSTRVWPQTEWLKAALIYGAPDDALAASRGLAGFLQAARPGLWRERMDGAGARPDGPAPATSLYHIMGAVTALLGASARLRC